MSATRAKVIAGYLASVTVVLGATVWCNRPPTTSQSGTEGATTTAQSLKSGKQQLAGHISREISAAPVLERVPPEKEMRLSIGLPVKDHDALVKHVTAVSEPSSPMFRHFVSPDEFGELHGASPRDYDAVRQWALANNLTVKTHRNRLVLTATGSAATVEAALDVHFNYATRPDGSRFWAADREPSVPASLRIEHIHGLDNYAVPQPLGSHGTGTSPSGAITPQNIRTAYRGGLSPGLTGAGQTVCVWSTGAIWPGVFQTYAETFDGGYGSNGYQRSHLLVSDANLTADFDGALVEILVDGGPKVPPMPGGETTADVEFVLSMAPAATIQIVSSGSGDSATDIASALQEIADSDCLQATTSTFQGALTQTEESLSNELALQGQSFFSALGDHNDEPPDASTFWVDIMWSQAVTGCGCTNMNMTEAGAYLNETSSTATTGGVMGYIPLPWYQRALAAGNQARDGGASLLYRNAVDVSAVGDHVLTVALAVVTDPVSPGSPYHQVYQKNETLDGCSVAAPLWAGFMALVNQYAAEESSAGAGGMGFANPALYSLTDAGEGYEPFHQAEVEDADSIYKVVPGWGYNLQTGLGSPTASLVANLAELEVGVGWTQENTGAYAPSTVNAVAAGGSGGIIAWVTDTSGSLWSYDGSTWTKNTHASNAIQPGVSPTNGYPWYLDSSNYVWEGSSAANNCTFTRMNGASGDPLISSFGLGPYTDVVGSGCIWAISTTSQGSGNYTVYYNDCINPGATWHEVSGVGGVQIAASPTDGTPWIVPASGHITMGTLSGGIWTFTKVVPFPWYGDGGIPDAGSFQGGLSALSLAVGPAWSYADAGSVANDAGVGLGVWVATAPLSGNSLYELVMYDSDENAAWNQVRVATSTADPPAEYGVASVSISAAGVPWLVDGHGEVWECRYCYAQ